MIKGEVIEVFVYPMKKLINAVGVLNVNVVMLSSYVSVYAEITQEMNTVRDRGVNYYRQTYNMVYKDQVIVPDEVKQFRETYLWVVRRQDVLLTGNVIRNFAFGDYVIVSEVDFLNELLNLALNRDASYRQDINLNDDNQIAYNLIDENDYHFDYFYDENLILIAQTTGGVQVVFVYYNDKIYASSLTPNPILADTDYTVIWVGQLWQPKDNQGVRQKFVISGYPLAGAIRFTNLANEYLSA